MNINGVNSVSFDGLWSPAKKLTQESGVYNKGKIRYTLYEYTYLPYANEAEEAINNEISKHFWGRSFSLWDKFDGQHKADLIQMNLIKRGNPIKQCEAQEYIEKGFNEKFTGGVISDNDFNEAYNNNTYAPYDISKMSEDYIKDVVKRKFSIEI